MNVDRLCGKRAVKGKPGTQGMDNENIKKFIMDKAPADVKTAFSRLQKKDRASMCQLLSQFEEGRKLLASSEPPKKANTPPRKTNIELMFEEAKKSTSPPKRSWANMAEEGDMMTNETEIAEMGNIEEGEEREGGDYENEPFGNLPLQPYVRPSRTKEKDPLKGNVKLGKRQKVMIRRELEKAKKAGKLPELKTAEEQLKFVLLKTPAEMAARAKARAPVRRTTKPIKVMTFLSTKNGGATQRIPTRPGELVLTKGPFLTKSEVRDVRNRINKILDRVTMNANVKKQLMNLGYTDADLKNIENGNNYNTVRNRLFKVNAEKRRVIKQLENSPTPPPRSPPKRSFSNIPGGPKPISQLLAPLKAKKAANLTKSERIQMRILQKMRNLELSRRRPISRMRITNVGNGVRNSNSDANSASPVRSPVGDAMMMAAIGSGDSNSNVENSPKTRAVKVIAEKAAKAKLPPKRPGVAKASAASALPVVVTTNGKTTLNGVNINSVNKPVLITAASKIYKKLKPNQNIPFASADVEMLKKLIKKGAKSLDKK